MKLVTVLISILISYQVIMAGPVISAEKMDTRKRIAVEIVGSDEGFLEEYSSRLTEEELTHFYRLAFSMAEEVAEETKDLIDDQAAYEYIQTRIESKNGVKNRIRSKVEEYLAGKYIIPALDTDDEYLALAGQMLVNLRRVNLQKEFTEKL